MPVNHQHDDWLDGLLARTPSWEPRDGFATRVVAAAAADGSLSHPPARGARVWLIDWASAWRDGFRARIEAAAWVTRQYTSLLPF